MLKRHNNGKQKMQIGTTHLRQVKLSKQAQYLLSKLLNKSYCRRKSTKQYVADRLRTTKLLIDVRARNSK